MNTYQVTLISLLSNAVYTCRVKASSPIEALDQAETEHTNFAAVEARRL